MTVSHSRQLNTLYVHTHGTHLGLEHDSVIITSDNRRTRLPLQRLDALVLFGNISASSPLLARCAHDGRSVTWLSPTGRFRYRIQGPTSGNVLLRQAQHHAHHTPEVRAGLAAAFVAAKLKNSRHVLLACARNTPESNDAERLRSIADHVTAQLPVLRRNDDLDQIRGIEGRAARMYFTGLRYAVRYDGLTDAGTRTRRPLQDPLNALLSFTYGLLRTRCEGALETVGLDPQIGFLHGIRPGRSSLALDLMEELRPVIADRFVLTLLNRRQLRVEHFEQTPLGGVTLTHNGRTAVLQAWQRQQDHDIAHRLFRTKIRAATLPVIQAQLVARHLRGDLPRYVPFTPAK